MQNITFYARAAETLGVFTDYANAKTKPAPILTRGVAVCLKMRLFREDGSIDPVPVDTFADVKAWQWVMDDDFDSTSNYILIAKHDQITVEAKTEEIEGETRNITEFSIPIPEMNTEELDAVLKNNENIANLNGELVGLNGSGDAVYILQLKGFTVRNRISSTGNPTPITAEYYTAEQTRAIIAGTNAYELARNAEFHIGDRAYYPGEPGYLLVCIADGTSAADLPELDKTVNSFLDGTVTWQVYDLSESGGGAANITVNGVSPDAEGNIKLEAANISFKFKDDMGYDIPTSGAISTEDLQRFFVSMQYAIFSVNGYSAWENEPGIINGNIDIYGDTMFLETPESGTPMQDWDGNPLSQKTVYDLAYDVYTHSVKEISTDGGETYSTAENGKLNLTINCPVSGWVAGEYGAVSGAYISLTDILDQLSRKSIRTINDNAVDDEDTGNINIYAGYLLMRNRSSEDDYPPTVDDAFYTTDTYKMGSPIYSSYGVQSCEPNTDYQTDDSTGYILLELGVRDGEVPTDPFFVTINEITVAEIIPAAGTRQAFMFPCPSWATWRCDSPGLPFEIVSIQFVPGEHITY